MLLFSCFISEDNKAQRGESLPYQTPQHRRTYWRLIQTLRFCLLLSCLWTKASYQEADTEILKLKPHISHMWTRNSRNWEIATHKPKQRSLWRKNPSSAQLKRSPSGVLKKAAEGEIDEAPGPEESWCLSMEQNQREFAFSQTRNNAYFPSYIDLEGIS